MAIVYLALGSNIGDSKAYIEVALHQLDTQIADTKCAPMYISKAVGYTYQADFLNTVAMGKTSMKPDDLLIFVKDIEKQVGRVEHFRWGPREIDIDIIFYDDDIIDKPNLAIPHARFRERDFVLKPLCDINPNIIDPVTKLTVQELLNQLPVSDLSVISKLTK